MTGLKRGGAEMGKTRLLANIDREEFSSDVISLGSDQPLGATLVEMGIPVYALNINPCAPTPADLFRLAQLMKRLRPDIIHSHMYHANLATGIVRRARAGVPLIWSIHSTSLPDSSEKLRTILVNRLCIHLSHRWPNCIQFCSEASKQAHCDAGYPESISTVVPNGFDTAQFAPDPMARESVRRELGLTAETLLVGLFARFHPIKDHQTFLAAAARVKSTNQHAHFVLCGDSVDLENAALRKLIDEYQLGSYVHVLGPRRDIPRLTAALDVASLSSLSESFPQVVGEAMSSCVVPVTTDVGDVKSIVQDAGFVVPTRDPDALARAISTVLDMPEQTRRDLGARARQRIQENFSLAKMVAAQSDIYRALAKKLQRPVIHKAA